MIDEAARHLFSVQVDKAMPEAQRAALGTILADYGFADVPINASLMQFGVAPPWCIELAVDARQFLRNVAGVTATLGLGAVGGAAASALDLGGRIDRFFARLGAVPGQPDG